MPRQTWRWQRHHQKDRRDARSCEFARQTDCRNGRRRDFQHRQQWKRFDERVWPDCSDRGSLGDCRLSARVAIKLARFDERFDGRATGRAEMIMSSQKDTTHLPPPLDLSGWRKVPAVLMVVGGILSVIGLIARPADFGFCWLMAFMFYLSIALGALFLVIVHHLTDAGWSVPIRRFCEHIASLLFPWLAILFIPILLLAPKIFAWLTLPATDAL